MSCEEFLYPVYIPSTAEYINAKEVKNKHVVVMSKYIANNDDAGLDSYFHRLLDHITGGFKNLNKVDKFCVLLTARIVSMGPEIKLTMTCEKTSQNYNGVIDLNAVLQLVSDVKYNQPRVIRLNKEYSVTVGTPTNMFHDTTLTSLDMFIDIVQEITIRDQVFDMKKLTLEQKNNIINNIPGVNFKKILQAGNVFYKGFHDLVFFTDKNPHDKDSKEKNYKLGIYDKTMFDLVKMSYNYNLNDMYITMYNLCNVMNFDSKYAFEMTPMETSIYTQRKAKEIDEQKKANESKTPQVGARPPGGL